VSGDADLAELARRALERPDAVSVMRDAIELVARALEVKHVTILELSPADERLRLRAGVGWGDGVVGTTVNAMPGGHVAYTLASAEPVVVDDLGGEQRFAISPQLIDAGVRSSLSVRIPSGGPVPFGVIGAHATEARSFSAGEVALVERIAAIVGAAIANQRRALDVHDGILQALVVAHYSLGAGDVDAAAGAVRAAHEEARSLVEHLLGDVNTEPLPGDLRRHFLFAAEQRRAAGDVEKQGARLVGLLHADQGTVSRAPPGQKLQQFAVGLGIVRRDVRRSRGTGARSGPFEKRLGLGQRHAGADAGGDGGPRTVPHLLRSATAARSGRSTCRGTQHHGTPFKLRLHEAESLQGPMGEPQTQHPFHR
jgi:GAF domain-containing protein